MWAFAYEGRIAFDALTAVERGDPDPGADEVVIAIEAVALNYRDLAIASGHYHVGVEPPLIPLSDGAGYIVAVGSGVTRFKVGDLACPLYLPDWIDGPVSPRVARRRLGGPSDGVLRQYVCVGEEEAVLAPSHLSAEEAATLPVASVTAWHCLQSAGAVRPGDTIVVQGAGAVSAAAVQIAAAAGAQVLSWTRQAAHAETLRALGADEVITAGDGDLAKAVYRLTGGRGADSVVHVAGGALTPALAAMKVGGCLHLVGYAADGEARFDIFEAIRRAARVQVATAGNRDDFEALVRAMAQHELRPAIGSVHAVSRLADAFAELAAGGVCGKVVVRI